MRPCPFSIAVSITLEVTPKQPKVQRGLRREWSQMDH